MKQVSYFFGILVLLFSFSTCDEIDELTERDVNTSVTERITVTIDAGEAVDLYSYVKVNIDNDDTHDYLNSIEKVRINSLTYKVVDFVGDMEGRISADLMADSILLATHTDVIVFDEIGELYTITDTSTLSNIATKLKNGADVIMSVTVNSSSETGMEFEIEITLNLTVTVDVG